MAHDTSSDSENEIIGARAKLFGHEKPIHEVLGGGKVADMLLWRDRYVSGALLGGMTVIWFLFEIVEYNFVALLCHISITTMLVLFIWSTVADIFKWYLANLLNFELSCGKGPQIPNIVLQESFFHDLASILHKRFNQLLPMLLHISCGIDLPIFLLQSSFLARMVYPKRKLLQQIKSLMELDVALDVVLGVVLGVVHEILLVTINFMHIQI
ncbi:Reticulon-like protein B9 [Glycine soja]|uniref:Reticulon-like protein n=1 Tax=Glycine soja TaxID=3848 RepID=A0A445JUS7_GLYSO|nr:Reticulon-like protein B9 [Glycine soja]